MHLSNPYSVQLISSDDFIVFNKRSGFRTHKVNENQLGLVEVLTDKLQQQLYVVHRLDKETSGLILFAKSKETAAELAQQFELHHAKKTYFFLTDQNISDTSFITKSHIEKTDKSFINAPNKPHNSETEFSFVQKIHGGLSLWQAKPITGKPHQIRLHAELMKIPVLGDNEHGGSPWFRLALHAGYISFQFAEKKIEFTAPLPFCFQNEVKTLGAFLENEFTDLSQIMTLQKDQTYRLYHRTNQEQEIRIDLYGQIVWIYWYKTHPPTADDLTSVQNFCDKHNLKYVLRHMINRGTGVGGLEHKDLYYTDAPEKWIAQENQIKIELRRDQGFSPGLFLDQRSNREWLLRLAKNKSVLNLFSYTSIFSVAAGLGGATQITTVDASANFLNWSKDNFKLNGLNPEAAEFFAQDSILFLKGALNRKRTWDLMICDPPSFGRTKTTTWKIEKDLPDLIKLMWSCLNSKGSILFTCNYEKWTLMDIQKVFEKALPKGQFKFGELPIPDLDFEFPDAYDNLLKGLIITKN